MEDRTIGDRARTSLNDSFAAVHGASADYRRVIRDRAVRPCSLNHAPTAWRRLALRSSPPTMSKVLASLPAKSARLCLNPLLRMSATGWSSAFMKPYSSATLGFNSLATSSSRTAIPYLEPMMYTQMFSQSWS